MPDKYNEELPISGDIGDTIPQPSEDVSENKVPHNLLKTPRGVNPAKRAGFYANEKPEVLGKTLEESSGVPKGAVFPVVETTPETVFVEWGTRPSDKSNGEAAVGGHDEEEPLSDGGMKGPATDRDFILKEGIAPLDRVADAEVEVFYSYSDSVEQEHQVENYVDVDFSLRDILLMTTGSWKLYLIAGDNTFTLVARYSSPSALLPTDHIFTYVKVTIPGESKVVSKLPAECVEGTLNLEFAERDLGKVLGVVDYGMGRLKLGLGLVEKDAVVQPIVLYYDKTGTKFRAYSNSALTGTLSWDDALSIKNEYEKGHPIFLCAGGSQSSSYGRFAVTYVYHNHTNNYDILGVGAVVALNGENNTIKYEFKIFEIYNDH